MTTLAEDYLSECGGDVMKYHNLLTAGQRIGQAFYNSLSNKDRVLLNGNILDPFYRDTDEAVAKAIDFLLAGG